MSSDRRRHLVRLAGQYDFHILADEVYQLVHFEHLPPPPLISFDEDSRVISFGSFSKILAPGLRTGWIHGSKAVVSRFSDSAVAFSGGGFNHYASALIREIIDMGLLDEHVERLRRVYARRAAVMNDALQTSLGEVIEYAMPRGGYYFWLRFLDGLDTEDFLQTAQRNGVSYRPGNAFSESGRFTNNLRLTYTLFEPDDIREGITRLASAHRHR